MKTLSFQRKISLLLVLSMALTLALGCAGCSGGAGGTGSGTEGGAGGASAASMFLRKTEGTVAVADAEGEDVAPAENLGLYSGYTVGTEATSYAWIDLDKVKLTKLDENSAAVITKDGKNLSIEITSGSMFFNVTEPLAEDETMEIRTSSMLVGIRGTCGWVEVPDSNTMLVYLLEGKVECVAGENTVTVNAGEMAEMTADGAIEVSEFTAWDVPAFVAEEMEADEALSEAVLAASGIDVDGNPMIAYADVFAWMDGKEILFEEEIDFEADGKQELMVLYTDEDGYGFDICRKGVAQSEFLYSTKGYTPDDSERLIISLVESEDRLFVCICQDSESGGITYAYYGSVAENDGDNSYWGRIDWVWISPVNSHKRAGLSENGLRWGPGEYTTIEEIEAVIAQYTEVRVLVEV